MKNPPHLEILRSQGKKQQQRGSEGRASSRERQQSAGQPEVAEEERRNTRGSSPQPTLPYLQEESHTCNADFVKIVEYEDKSLKGAGGSFPLLFLPKNKEILWTLREYKGNIFLIYEDNLTYEDLDSAATRQSEELDMDITSPPRSTTRSPPRSTTPPPPPLPTPPPTLPRPPSSLPPRPTILPHSRFPRLRKAIIRGRFFNLHALLDFAAIKKLKAKERESMCAGLSAPLHPRLYSQLPLPLHPRPHPRRHPRLLPRLRLRVKE
jgi:hypothetical protein